MVLFALVNAEELGVTQANVEEMKGSDNINVLRLLGQEGDWGYSDLGLEADALANAITLMDGLIVVGGGLANAYPLFIDAILAEMNGTIESYGGDTLPRIVQKCFDLENKDACAKFLEGTVKQLTIPGTDKTVPYDSLKRLGIGHAVLDTSQAVAIGAYVFALNQLDSGS